jgi:hypothetical protein
MTNQVWVVDATVDGKVVKSVWGNSVKEAEEKRSRLQEDIFTSYPNAIVGLPYAKFIDSK